MCLKNYNTRWTIYNCCDRVLIKCCCFCYFALIHDDVPTTILWSIVIKNVPSLAPLIEDEKKNIHNNLMQTTKRIIEQPEKEKAVQS